jgi:eukaryotic-like serine/threonine-protein kinase
MQPLTSRIEDFLREVRRRQVHKAAAVCAAVAFVIWQAADIAAPALHMPAWTMTAVVLLALLGFPMVLVTAWFFDLTRHGLLRTDDATQTVMVTASVEGDGAWQTPAASTGDVALESPVASDGDVAHLRSIVVLPFANVGGNAEDEYFSDGLTDEITADLGRVRALRVICRTSAMTLKGASRGAGDVGRQLGVRYLLEGSVRRGASTMRITARLVDTRTEAHVWSDRYDVATEDVLDVQERVARQIVAALGVELGVEEERMLAARPIEDAVAYDCYLRARHVNAAATPESTDRAVALLRVGLERAPGNARLPCTIAFMQVILMRAQGAPDLTRLNEFAREAMEILAREPRSADAHLVLGVVHFERGEQREAAAALQRALQLDPSHQDAATTLGLVYLYAGQIEQARSMFQKMRVQDPLSPLPFCIASAVEWFDGDFEAGVAPMERALELAGGSPIWRWHWGYLLVLLGRHEEAAAEAERIAGMDPEGKYTRQLLSLTAGLRGDTAAARTHLAGVSDDGTDHHLTFHLAECHVLVGDLERAASLVAAAVERGFFPYAFIALHNPFMRRLQGNPQYETAVREAKRRWLEFRG